MSEIDRATYLERLAEYADDTDWEGAHVKGDEVLCELLTELGYADVVAAWGEINKWYA